MRVDGCFDFSCKEKVDIGNRIAKKDKREVFPGSLQPESTRYYNQIDIFACRFVGPGEKLHPELSGRNFNINGISLRHQSKESNFK